MWDILFVLAVLLLGMALGGVMLHAYLDGKKYTTDSHMDARLARAEAIIADIPNWEKSATANHVADIVKVTRRIEEMEKALTDEGELRAKDIDLLHTKIVRLEQIVYPMESAGTPPKKRGRPAKQQQSDSQEAEP